MFGSLAVACLIAPSLASAGVRLEATILNEATMPDGIQRAQLAAGEGGFVASLPQLMWARVKAGYANEIWNNWFTANTEECAFITKEGKKVVVVVHGGGIFSMPNRLAEVYKEDGSGMTYDSRAPEHGNDRTDMSAGKITEKEAKDLLNGKLPDGSKIPIFTSDAFMKTSSLPQRYAVIVDAEVAKKSPNGYAPVKSLYKDDLFVVRAGGPKYAAAYVDKAKARHRTTKYGTWHPYARINYTQPQCRIVFLSGNEGGQGSDGSGTCTGYGEDYGIGGDADIMGRGRYIAVAKVNQSATIGNANFAGAGGRRAVRPEAVWARHLALAMQTAKATAGAEGSVAALPDIMAARTATHLQNEVWSKTYATTSEESIVEGDRGALKVVTVHGGGIFSTPERILSSLGIDSSYKLMTGDYAARLSKEEASRLLEGELPDGTKIPMYSFDQFKRGIAHLPRRYGVITDFEVANKSVSGTAKLSALRHDPMMLVRAGGARHAAAYLDAVGKRQSSLSNSNPYHTLYKSLVPSSRILFLSSEGGVEGTHGMVNMGRYVALVPDKKSTSLRYLDYVVPYREGNSAAVEFTV